MQDAPLAVVFCVLPPAYCVLQGSDASLIPTVKADQCDSPHRDTRKMIEKARESTWIYSNDRALL